VLTITTQMTATNPVGPRDPKRRNAGGMGLAKRSHPNTRSPISAPTLSLVPIKSAKNLASSG